MRHLTPEQLVDAAESAAARSTLAHLAVCEECRRAVTDCQSVLRAVERDVPEPSPLFWDHLSARVRAAVDAEPDQPTRGWLVFDWRRVSITVASAAAIAAIVFVVSNRERPVTPSMSFVDPVSVERTVAADDPSLAFVSELSNGMDWDAAHDAGLVAHSGLMDRAVGELSPGERAELRKLLQEELAKGGA
jgi:hypothetical protein